jgi:hypothetical protein
MTFIDDILREAEVSEEQKLVELDQLRADQMLMAIQKLEDQQAEVGKLVDSEMKLLEEYRDVENTRLERKANWLSTNLEHYMRGLESKTVTLPHGTLKIRKGRDKVEVSDLDTFFAAPGHEALVRVIPESYQPDLASIYGHVKATGEVPQGVTLIPGESKFSYSTSTRRSDNGTEHE